MSGYPKGIDVSNNNGEFDWSAWDGLAFAMAKATEGPHGSAGMFYDSQFARNWRLMHDLYGGKLVRFAYHFLHPASSIPDQAQALLKTVRAAGLKDGDHFVVDLEPYAGLATPDSLPAAEVAARTREFCHLVNKDAPGHRVLVYCSASMGQAGCTAGLGPWRLWVANYTSAAKPELPAPWKDWHFWQFAAGDGGPDLNVWNGTVKELLDFARMPADRR